jgi:sulfite reductase (NADPH) flavoprotein alpha-component
LHKTIWFKIHWFLGITAGTILLIVGLSGAMLSFEEEIMHLINKNTYEVTVKDGQEKLSTKELLEKFQYQLPEAKINSISFSSDKTTSTVINVKGEGKESRKGINYYVNPYDATILPELKGKEFFSFVLTLHRWLAFSGEARDVGKQAVGISTIALIVLMISGIIVYWNRISRTFFKSFTFSFKHKNRAFLSTMHSAIGMWVIPFYLVVSLTGIIMSYDVVRDTLYNMAGVQKPQKMQGSKPQEKEENKIAKFDEYQKAIDLFDNTLEKKYSNVTLKFPQNGTVYSFNYTDLGEHCHHKSINNLELDISTSSVLKHELYRFR